MVGTVKGQLREFVIDKRLKMNRPSPNSLDVSQGIGRVVQAQVHPRVLMLQE
jgi:hypothetical protein